MNEIKTFIVSAVVSLLGYLAPVEGVMQSLLAILLLNFLCGALAGYVSAGESFSWRKATAAIGIGALISFFICCLYFIGERQGSREGSLFCISCVMYLCDYVFGVNILRNLCLIFRRQPATYRLFRYLYLLLSAEIVKRLPALSDIVKADKTFSDMEEDGAGTKENI